MEKPELTNSVEHSPSWQAARFLPSQEIPRVLCDPKVHYSMHNSPPPVPALSQIDPVRVPQTHLFKIHFNFILPSTPKSSKLNIH